MHSLAPIAGITSVSGSISTPKRRVVEVGEGLAELLAAAVARVLLGAGVGDRLLHRLDDVRVGRLVGVADAEADHVDAGGALVGDLALELGEHVRRDRLQALGRVGDAHRRGNLSIAGLSR